MNQSPSENSFFSLFGHPTRRLTVEQKQLLWVVSIFIALTRVIAISKSLWDWDEALFTMSLNGFDVASHRPHPPGFPVFVFVARLMNAVIHSNFRSLQVIAFLAAIFVFPAVSLLTRELRFPFSTSVIAGVLCAFMPTVWYFGGTGLTDVPSMVCCAGAAALLLHGGRRRWALLAGCVLAGAAIGIRSQNVVVLALPALIGGWYRWKERKRDVVLGALIVFAIVAVAYGMAIWLTGPERYRDAVAAHRDYLWRIDSYHNPLRPSIKRLFNTFFTEFYRAGKYNRIITFFVLVSVVRAVVKKRRHIILPTVMFLPFAIMALFYLDYHSASRFAIGYIVLWAILAADGIEWIARLVAPPLRLTTSVVATIVTCVIVILLTTWTVPALNVVRTTLSPNAAAAQWIRQHTDPRKTVIYAALGMEPFVQALLPEYPEQPVGDNAEPPIQPPAGREGLYVVDGFVKGEGAEHFSRPRKALRTITTHGYTDVTVLPLNQLVRFRSGWYDEEGSGEQTFRWMGHRGSVLLPAGSAGTLSMDMLVPLDVLKQPPAITVSVNGTPLETFAAPGQSFSRKYHLIASAQPRELVLETSAVVNPAKLGILPDKRDLGIQLSSVRFKPDRGAASPDSTIPGGQSKGGPVNGPPVLQHRPAAGNRAQEPARPPKL